jgi:hypothetical protein
VATSHAVLAAAHMLALTSLVAPTQPRALQL